MIYSGSLLALFYLFIYLIFRAAPAAYGSSQARGWIGATAGAMPQSQQHRIWAESVTYTTAHSNARSLTHWVRPGIEPSTSWFLVSFVSAVPWRELLYHTFFIRTFKLFPCLGYCKLCYNEHDVSPHMGQDGHHQKSLQKVGVPIVAQWRRIQLGTMRLLVQSLASLSELRIQHCCELWCRSQTQLGFGIAMAVA